MKGCSIDKLARLCYYVGMSKSQQMKITHKPTSLEGFTLGFEYNKTLQEIKREVRIRTI